MNFKKNRIKKKPLQILKDYSTDFFERIKGIDRITLILVAILFGIGLIMVYSITSISIYNGVKGDPSNLFIKTLSEADLKTKDNNKSNIAIISKKTLALFNWLIMPLKSSLSAK